MPVATIYLSTKNGGSDHILSGGMISTDFLLYFLLFLVFRLFFMFFVFLGYYTTFCLVLCISLSVFGNKPLRERGDGRYPILPGS